MQGAAQVMDLAEGAEADDVDDGELVARAQRDRRAFAPLYARYVAAIYRYCYHRLGDRADAEDATSAVFARALAALPRYRQRHDQAFRSWLFTIAYHTVADCHRRSRSTRPLAAADGLASTAASPEELILWEHDRASLHALLGQLPPDQRRVMELRLSGLTGPETARVIGRSPEAVRSLQFRAVERLRALLGITVGAEEVGRDAL